MTFENQQTEDGESGSYRFWTPASGRQVTVGAEQRPVPLPAVPLPIHRQDLQAGEPSADAIGRGVYDYLRQFPDCRHNLIYAELLRDAFPHFLADLGAQVAMLEHKEVDPFYVRRKITGMKILSLLEPGNAGLWRQLGVAAYELAMTFNELGNCRQHLLQAMGWLQRSLKLHPDDLVSLNHLGQIDFFFGDYPAAARRWNGVINQLEDGPVRRSLEARVQRIDREEVPDHPLVDDLEEVGTALAACGRGDFQEALGTFERLEENGTLPAECPTPEFFYLLGLCRARTGEAGGAFEAFEKALQIDPEFQPALAGREDILEGRKIR